MGAGVDGEPRHLAGDRPGERIEQRDRIDAVIEQLDPHRLALGLGGKDVDDVPAHAVGALGEIQLVARVLHVGKAAQELALLEAVPALQVQHHGEVGLRIAQAVDRGHGRDDDRIRAFEQRLGRREAHLLDVLIHRGVLLDVGVRGGDVGLRLIVVVVGDEVLERVVRKELAELPVQLRREGLVMRQNHGGALHALDHTGR